MRSAGVSRPRRLLSAVLLAILGFALLAGSVSTAFGQEAILSFAWSAETVTIAPGGETDA